MIGLRKSRSSMPPYCTIFTHHEGLKPLNFQDGRVVETGTHAELIAIENGVYRQLVDSQNLNETGPLPKKISKKSTGTLFAI